MDFFSTVQRRRSVRKFTAEPVPPQVIHQALDAALLAPNSSNLQPWEFYWVKSSDKKAKLVKFCFSQGAAATAQELIVAVSRVDTWKRNKQIILQGIQRGGTVPKQLDDYYNKIVPMAYLQDAFGILGLLKWLVFSVVGIFSPVPRSPRFRSELFEVVTKTTALACENLMLAIAALGFDSCPMEGFDEKRVKKLLGLGRKTRVVMVIGIGRGDPAGIYGERFRIEKNLVVHEV